MDREKTVVSGSRRCFPTQTRRTSTSGAKTYSPQRHWTIGSFSQSLLHAYSVSAGAAAEKKAGPTINRINQ